MKDISIFGFKSEKPQTPFAPAWNYYIAEAKLDVDISTLLPEIKNIVTNIKKSAPVYHPVTQPIFRIKEGKITREDFTESVVSDGNTKLGKGNIMSRYSSYNIFKSPVMEGVVEEIRSIHNRFLEALGIKIPPFFYINGWINIIKFGEKVHPHIHSINPQCYLGGNLCMSDSNTKTYYINPVNQVNYPEILESYNEMGKLTLFQNCIPHYTDRYWGLKDRVTLAFNMRMHNIDPNALKVSTFNGNV